MREIDFILAELCSVARVLRFSATSRSKADLQFGTKFQS
jgi:hypothetical protein